MKNEEIMNEQIFDPSSGKLGYILIILGFVTKWAANIEDIDLILGVVLKITSLISFIIFVILNFKKVKKILRGED